MTVSDSKNLPPLRFLWGAATSSHQIEGDNIHNDWWDFESKGNTEGGVRSGKATDHWSRWEEDLDLAAGLGLNSYRFSIEWSRIEPKEGQWNQSAIEWYRQLLEGCANRNLLPMVTLHHFTSPLWFSEKGGFTWEGSSQAFARYVEKVVEELGHLSPLWCTINEPMVLTVGGYLGGFMPPGLTVKKLVPLVCENLLRSHVKAYDLIHSKVPERLINGPWKDETLAVGIAHNMVDFIPDHSWHPWEVLLSKTLHRFYNRAWLDAIAGKKQHFSVIGLVPKAAVVKEALGRKTADFVGVNYYTKAYVCWKPKNTLSEVKSNLPFGLAFSRRFERQSNMGWAIHPKGFKRILKFVADYQLPIYITENGIADRHDEFRSEFILEHVYQVAKRIEKGLDIRGYYYWSLLDNFEWVKGFGPRFGLLHVDYDNFNRRPRKSAHFYQQLIEEHQGSLPPSRKRLERFLAVHPADS